MDDYDAIVIGTGQSGPSLAAHFDREGLKVAVACTSIRRWVVSAGCNRLRAPEAPKTIGGLGLDTAYDRGWAKEAKPPGLGFLGRYSRYPTARRCSSVSRLNRGTSSRSVS